MIVVPIAAPGGATDASAADNVQAPAASARPKRGLREGGSQHADVARSLRAVADARAAGDRLAEGLAQLALAQVYRERSLTRQASDAARAAARIALHIGEPAMEADARALAADAAFDRGEYAAALQQGLKALQLREQHGTPADVAASYHALGDAYRAVRDHAPAEAYLRRSLEAWHRLGPSSDAVARVHSSQAWLEVQRGDVAAARVAADAARRHADAGGSPRTQAHARLVQGQVALLARTFQPALTHAEDALVRFARLDDARGMAMAWQIIGDVRLAMGRSIEGMTAIREALRFATVAESAVLIAPAARTLYEWHADRGELAPAIEYLRQHTEARALLYNEETAQRLSAVQASYRAERAHLERMRDEVAASRSSMVRNTLAGGCLVLLLLVVLLWRVAHTRRESARRYRAQAGALRDAQAKTHELEGLLPICARCKNVRGDDGYWKRIEEYLTEQGRTGLTHGLCPTCEHTLLDEASKEPLPSGLAGPPHPPVDGLQGGPQGGFDWPPSAEEIARAQRISRPEPVRPTGPGGRWS